MSHGRKDTQRTERESQVQEYRFRPDFQVRLAKAEVGEGIA